MGYKLFLFLSILGAFVFLHRYTCKLLEARKTIFKTFSKTILSIFSIIEISMIYDLEIFDKATNGSRPFLINIILVDYSLLYTVYICLEKDDRVSKDRPSHLGYF